MANSTHIRQDPAYQLYTSDFLVRTLDMSDEQVGKYIRLLCFQHQNGHLTESTMLSYCKGKDELVFSKFLKDENGLYYNEEMEKEKSRRSSVSKTKSNSASLRWEKEKEKEREKQSQSTFHCI
jgi:hypothetical protein